MWCDHDLDSNLNNFITKENRLQANKNGPRMVQKEMQIKK